MNTSVTVGEVMDRAFVGVNESDGLRETVELMVEDGAESVVVLRGQEPVGVLSERDVLEHLVSEGLEAATVADAMDEVVPTVDPDVTLSEAASELTARATQRLVVTDGTEPVGVLTEHDLMNTSPFSRDVIAETGETGSMAGTTGTDPETGAGAGAGGGTGPEVGEAESPNNFEDQSICEACGSFARDLFAINGQMLCSDCRDI